MQVGDIVRVKKEYDEYGRRVSGGAEGFLRSIKWGWYPTTGVFDVYGRRFFVWFPDKKNGSPYKKKRLEKINAWESYLLEVR